MNSKTLSLFNYLKPPFLLPYNPSIPTTSLSLTSHFPLSTPIVVNPFLKFRNLFPLFSFKPQPLNPRHSYKFRSLNTSIESNIANSVTEAQPVQLDRSDSENQSNFVEIRNPNVPPFISSWSLKFSPSDRAFFILTFIASTTCVALISFVAAAVPTLYAMGRAANSFAKLADTAREELPGTMAAIRLSGMETSDLTIELSDLSQEISEGVNKSAQVVQAAEVGVRQIGALAHRQTASLIEERANLPVISLRPVISGAAKKTSRAVGYATRSFLNIISGKELISENKADDSVDT